MKYYDKNKESSYLKYWDMINSNEQPMSQKLPADDGFKSVKNTYQFNIDFIKNSEDCGEEHFLKVDFQYPERLYDLYDDLHFLPKTMKIEKVEKNEKKKITTAIKSQTKFIEFMKS